MVARGAPPFFVFEGRDLSIYDSLISIEENLEGMDVEDGIYEAFDSIGRVIILKATGVKREKFAIDIGETHVDTLETTPTGAGRLYNLLCDHLRYIGQLVPHGSSLEDLVAKFTSMHKHR